MSELSSGTIDLPSSDGGAANALSGGEKIKPFKCLFPGCEKFFTKVREQEFELPFAMTTSDNCDSEFQFDTAHENPHGRATVRVQCLRENISAAGESHETHAKPQKRTPSLAARHCRQALQVSLQLRQELYGQEQPTNPHPHSHRRTSISMHISRM